MIFKCVISTEKEIKGPQKLQAIKQLTQKVEIYAIYFIERFLEKENKTKQKKTLTEFPHSKTLILLIFLRIWKT